ncbi:Firmicu-CTERM sorting domain-containing protein [Olsenella sp. YH-ols2223]|uniref:Firmicu-CTERM sorting domain-containing protein n=1 Tax=Olsenella absiana TaxID=3115222 RepID=A0ABU7RBU3_9ACTN
MKKQSRVAGVLRAGLVISLSASMATWMPVQYAQAAAVAAEGSAAGTSDVADAAAGTSEAEGADATSEAGGNASADEANGAAASGASAEASGSKADSSAAGTGDAASAEAAAGGAAAAKASPALAPAAPAPAAPTADSAATGPTVTGNITVDGSDADWGGVPAQATTTTTNGIDSWKVARDASGNVYLLAQGTAQNQWYSNYQWTNVGIVRDGSTVNNPQLANLQWNGGSFASVNEANGTTAGPFTAEALIPASMLTGSDAISFLGTTVSLADIPVLDGNDYVAPDEPATYDGITVDGKFKDWKYVTKTDVKNPNPDQPNALSQVAMVFDGDVYIYIKEGQGGSAAGAGTHANGKYSIISDLGRENVFQLNQDGTVSGIAGAEAKHVGSEWEIRIPRESLNYYSESLSFGLYQSEPFVKDVTDLQGKPSNTGTFQGITYDGNYDDWNSYPVTTISYATAGTQDKNEDASAALHADGSTLYMYAETTMQAHIAEQRQQGTAFTQAITIDLTGKASSTQDIDVNGENDLSPRIIAVDENGNIDWNPDLANQPDGTTREYAIVETHGTYDTNSMTNIDNAAFQEMGGVLGHVMITANGDKCQAEYKIDLENVAKMHNYYRSQHGKAADDSPDNYQFISARFGRLGDQIVTTTGASTGPWLGLGLSGIAVAGGLLANSRRAKRKKDLPASETTCR